MSYTTRFVGIDISKSSFDICVLPDKTTATYANTPEGVTASGICLVYRWP